MERNRPNRNAASNTVTEADVPVTAPVEAAQTEEQKAEAEKAKRAPRPPINVGEVTVRKSTRDLSDLTTRPSKITSDPVYLAVKAAPFDEPQDIDASPDKVEAVVKRLRTASDAKHLNVGMTIVPGNPVSPVDETKVVVTFIKRKERATRVKAAAEGATTEATAS